MNEWCKCNFCKNSKSTLCFDCYDYSVYPGTLKNFNGEPIKIIEKSKESGLSVADIISLINFTGGF